MAKNGLKPIGGALVFVLNDESKVYYARTNADGEFSLDAPIGSRDLNIQTGGGVNFRTTLHVDIVQNQTIAINPMATRLDQVARMAYVTGDYDSIQTIITGMGYTVDMITNADLLDYSVVSQYDIIYLNCGAKQSSSTANQQLTDTNLSNFVTNGGSIYASDFAIAYLTGGEIYSTQCGEANGFIPDNNLCTTAEGAAVTISGAQVVNADLASSVGFSTLDIVYDLSGWDKIMNFEPSFWDVLVNDPATNNPLMIKTNHYNGGLVLSPVGHNAADEGWITICHHGENESFTMTIPQIELANHEAHGDSIGSCENSGSNGTIYFTTFHNEVGGNIASTEPILQYVILNL